MRKCPYLFFDIVPGNVLLICFTIDTALGRLAYVSPLNDFVKVAINEGNSGVLSKNLEFRLPLPVSMCVYGSDEPVKVSYSKGTRSMNFPLYVHVPKFGIVLTESYA